MTLDSQIEAVLFYKGDPVTIGSLVKTIGVPESMILEELITLENNLKNRGLILLRNGDEVTLSTSSEASEIISALSKEELDKTLSRASLETLAIVLYRGPIARSEIEYIRGVQSNFILRTLSIRGLIERIENPEDQRGFLYTPTFDLLRYLGIDSLDKMPEYAEIHKKLASISEKTEGSSATLESPKPEA